MIELTKKEAMLVKRLTLEAKIDFTNPEDLKILKLYEKMRVALGESENE